MVTKILFFFPILHTEFTVCIDFWLNKQTKSNVLYHLNFIIYYFDYIYLSLKYPLEHAVQIWSAWFGNIHLFLFISMRMTRQRRNSRSSPLWPWCWASKKWESLIIYWVGYYLCHNSYIAYQWTASYYLLKL